jgi:MFS transporter, DHA1 family, tetracycline resistance protein
MNTLSQRTHLLTLLSLLMVIFLDIMGILLVLPVLTTLLLQSDSILPLATSLKWRTFIYGFSLALFPLFMFFSTPILGDLSDRFGRKKILLACLIGGAISYLISAIAIEFSHLSLLLISRIIAGLAAGTQSIASAAIIDLSTPNTKTRYLSWITMVSSIGVIIGPILGGITAEKNLSVYFGHETPFIFAALLGFMNAIFLFFTYKDHEIKVQGQSINLTKGFILFLSAFSKPKFRLLSLSAICYFLAWSLYFQAIGWFLMKAFHYSEGKIGLFMGYIGAIGALALACIMRIALNFFTTEKNTYIFFVAITGLAITACTFTSSSELSQWLWVMLGAMGDVICYTLLLSLFSNLADDRSQGWIMGVVNAIAAMTWALGGLLVGPLGYINILLPFWIGGLLCLFSFIFILLLKK